MRRKQPQWVKRRELILIGSLIAGAVIVTLDEILDLPHLLLGAPPTPTNWKEIIAELPLAFCIKSRPDE